LTFVQGHAHGQLAERRTSNGHNRFGLLSTHDEGRRRAISVIAALPASLRATTLIARRRDARGGPEG
jgi:hypothetical protein